MSFYRDFDRCYLKHFDVEWRTVFRNPYPLDFSLYLLSHHFCDMLGNKFDSFIVFIIII